MRSDRVTMMPRMSLRKAAWGAGRTGWILSMALVLLFASAFAAQAQTLSVAAVGSGAVSIEAGSATSAASNPALLGLRRHAFQVNLAPLSARFGNNAYTLNDLDEFLLSDDGFNADGHWDEEELGIILGRIPTGDGAWAFGGDAAAGARLGIGPIGLGVNAVVVADRIGVDRDLFQLVFGGFEMDRTYSLKNSGGKVLSYGEVGGGLALPVTPLARALNVKQVHVGAAYKWVYGVGFAEVTGVGEGFRIVSPKSSNDKPKIEGDTTFTARYVDEVGGGQGYALDFGVAVQVSDSLYFDVALLNMGSITWDKVEEAQYEIEIDHELDFSGGGDALDQELDFVKTDERTLKNYKTELPQRLRMGVGGAVWNERLRWAVDYTVGVKGLGKGDSAFGAGVELSLVRILPLRFGLRSAMGGGLTYTAGFGLHLGPLTVDVATPDLKALFSEGKEFGIAMSTGIRF